MHFGWQVDVAAFAKRFEGIGRDIGLKKENIGSITEKACIIEIIAIFVAWNNGMYHHKNDKQEEQKNIHIK